MFRSPVKHSTIYSYVILLSTFVQDFYVRMTVRRNRLKWIKPTDALNPSFIGMTTLHVSGNLSAHHQEFWAVHRLWYLICIWGDRMLPGVGWQSPPTPGSIRLPQLHKMYQIRYMTKNSWWWAERLPETCRVVVPIKIEFNAPVGFIHFNLYKIFYLRTNDMRLYDKFKIWHIINITLLIVSFHFDQYNETRP